MPKTPIWKQKYLEAARILAGHYSYNYESDNKSKTHKGPYRKEKIPSEMAGLAEAFKKHVGKSPVKVDYECESLDGCNPKVVYWVPVGAKTQKVLVKPYKAPCEFGWAEQTAREVFHAVGLGRYIQKSFVATHGHPSNRVPVTVIKMESRCKEVCTLNSFHKDESFNKIIRRIAILDYVLDNRDRHGGNLMIKNHKTDPKPLAIDNGLCMSPDTRRSCPEFNPTDNEAFEQLLGGLEPVAADQEIKAWWSTVSKRVAQVIESRIQMLVDSGFDDFHIGLDAWKNAFEDRLAVLDQNCKRAIEPKEDECRPLL